MLSDSCFFNPWWSLRLSRILLSSFHGMISSFHGMIPSYHDMISSYHAVFGLRHRDKSAKVIGLSGQTRGKGIPLQASFHRRRLRWRMQTFTMAGANVYDGGCKRLWEKAHSFGESDPIRPMSVPISILQPQRKALGGGRLHPCPTWSGNLSCEQ